MKIANSLKVVAMLLVVAFSHAALSGCAAGNYGFIRTVAKWNLKMSLLPRVLVYIAFVIIPVYPIAMLLDLLIGNTIEFWTEKPIITVAHKTFEKDGMLVQVDHERNPLRKTTLTATDKAGKISVTQIIETPKQTIEVFVDGVKKAELKDIHDVAPLLVRYDESGFKATSTVAVPVSELPENRFAVETYLQSQQSSLVCAN